jgi:hypothetical protein
MPMSTAGETSRQPGSANSQTPADLYRIATVFPETICGASRRPDAMLPSSTCQGHAWVTGDWTEQENRGPPDHADSWLNAAPQLVLILVAIARRKDRPWSPVWCRGTKRGFTATTSVRLFWGTVSPIGHDPWGDTQS